MAYCSKCGNHLGIEAFYCMNCGTKKNQLEQTFKKTKISEPNSLYDEVIKPSLQSSNRYNNIVQRTQALTIVLVIQYLIITILGLITAASLIFWYSLFISPLLGLLLLIFTALLLSMVYSLQQYSNNARLVILFFLVLGFLLSVLDANILGIVICGFQILVLGFHKRTIDLFNEDMDTRLLHYHHS